MAVKVARMQSGEDVIADIKEIRESRDRVRADGSPAAKKAKTA